MWKPIEMDFCIECESPQPPLFDLPPPPLPPSLTMVNCIEQSGYATCNNLMFTDINYDALSMQTTAITLLCSVLFLIFIFVSSIFVWKYRFKRNMPYKTSYAATDRNLEASLHFNEYDSADGVNARFKQGMDHHHQSHHFIMLQTNVVHYTSAFPMLESSPSFDCTSQGPDPYESNYNLYEELDQYDEASDRSALSHNESFLDDPTTSAETTLVVSSLSNQLEPTSMLPTADPLRQKDCYMISKSHHGIAGPRGLINSQSSYNHQIPRTNANFYTPPFFMTRPPQHPTNGHNMQIINDSRFNTASRSNGNFSDFPRVFNNPRRQQQHQQARGGENEINNSNTQHQRPNRVKLLSSWLSELRKK